MTHEWSWCYWTEFSNPINMINFTIFLYFSVSYSYWYLDVQVHTTQCCSAIPHLQYISNRHSTVHSTIYSTIYSTFIVVLCTVYEKCKNKINCYVKFVKNKILITNVELLLEYSIDMDKSLNIQFIWIKVHTYVPNLLWKTCS